MKAYYQDDACTIYHGDCRDILPHLEPVDLVLTDPPYGIQIVRKPKEFGLRTDLSRKATDECWDDTTPDKRIWPMIFSKSQNQIVFGANFFWEQFTSCTCYIIWDKRGNLPTVPFSPMEMAWSSFKRMPIKYTCINHGFIKDSKEHKSHPTQKPLKLITQIVNDFSDEDNILLDPFMGSGTTLRAAKDLGRKSIGIELEEKYCEIAVERLRQEVLAF